VRVMHARACVSDSLAVIAMLCNPLHERTLVLLAIYSTNLEHMQPLRYLAL
jgi:hypothetical protein